MSLHWNCRDGGEPGLSVFMSWFTSRTESIHRLPTLTVNASVNIFILQTKQVKVKCESNHMPSKTVTLHEKPCDRAAEKLCEDDLRRAVRRLQRKTVPTEQVDYLQEHTWKKQCHIQTSGRGRGGFVQKQHNLGLHVQLEHDAWTISTWVSWAEDPSTSFSRQNKSDKSLDHVDVMKPFVMSSLLQSNWITSTKSYILYGTLELLAELLGLYSSVWMKHKCRLMLRSHV